MHKNIEEKEKSTFSSIFFFFTQSVGLCFSGVDWPALPGRVMVVAGWPQSGPKVEAAQLSI